ncbi:WD repeat-containing protein 35 [Orchesella cincta]|uniref:WD repeat-containing protein 35 n=1 Tax=Orchesella cincta TaxID=48709 RepID=A0A1D2N2K7_ORCCI|nr:WD repeat-containing protein 35 [Orchesella cincta]
MNKDNGKLSLRNGLDNDMLEAKRKFANLKGKHLPLLPSPRQLRSPPKEEVSTCKQRRLISISQLHPFFEEIDHSSSVSSSGEADGPAGVTNGRVPRKTNADNDAGEGFIKWSALGSSSLPGLPTAVKSRDSLSSSGAESVKTKSDGSKSVTQSSSSGTGLNKESRSSLKSKLKKVPHNVKKQLSATGGFLWQHRCGKALLEEHNPPPNMPIVSPRDCPRCRHHSPVTDNIEEPLDTPVPVNKIDEFGDDGLIFGLPNWVDNSSLPDGNGNNLLTEIIEDAKQLLAQRSPMEWAMAAEYLYDPLGRDFRRFLCYLEKGIEMHLTNLQAVRCLKFSPFRSLLAIGCEEGTPELLELDYEKPLFHLKSDENLQLQPSQLYYVPLGSECRVLMNATLVGHSFDLRCLTWNNENGKLVTSDEIGVIIGWQYNKQQHCWVEELIDDKSTSMIRDMVVSPDGGKIAIGYEDYDENGSITGGILVGLLDGTQIFDRKFPGSQVSFVEWYTDSTLWVVVNQTIYAFDEHGDVGKVHRSIAMNSQPCEITTLLLKPKSSWITSDSAPEFAVIYRESCMSFYSSLHDKAPLRIHTQIVATCADWSPNGLYIAVGGMRVTATEDGFSNPQISMFNYEGKLLQILKIPEHTITSVSWHHDSLHLALATERQVYFASLRPMYKVTSNGTVHCYAYTRDFITQKISFWNEKTFITENIPGKVIDIKCFKAKFAVLCMDTQGVYHVFVFRETGVHQHHLCIITMEPFSITLTKNAVVCLAPNAVLNWNYNLNSSEKSNKLASTLRPTRQVHIDDFPGIIPKPGEKNDHLLRPAIDCTRCMHALGDRLCVARESGKLQFYALPTLGYLQTHKMELDGDICQKVLFNSDGSQLALLSMNGNLLICVFPEVSGQQLQVIICENVSNVSGMMWASDIPRQICVVEGHNLHILQDGIIMETICNIPSGSFLTHFENQLISLLNMDKIVEDPEHPSSSLVLKLYTATYSRIRELLENDEPIEDIANLLNVPFCHTTLRRTVADEALRQGRYELGESIYYEDKNFAAVQFLAKLKEIEEPDLQRAQVHCFLNEYDQAQHHLLRVERKDLAIKMWKDLGEWEKVNFLSGYTSEDVTDKALENQYDAFVESQDYEAAVEIANRLGYVDGLIICFIMLEDYEKLIALSEKLPLADPALSQIGDVLASVGLIEAAAQCYVAYGNPPAAMQLTVDTQQWDLAMKLSYDHKLPLIGPSLVKHVRSLIASEQFSPAIQILERCGKILTAGKLLVWKALCMLESEFANTLEVKKVFALAAKMLSKQKSRVNRESITCLNASFKDCDELDLEFLIPEDQLRIMTGHNEWCWSDPWRGAEASHFLNLTQRFLHRGMLGRAFKAAMHLRNFEDIVGSQRINTLVALTAINNYYYNVASNALLKLEAEDETFSSISFKLFKDQCPKDHGVNRIPCQGCEKYIPDIYSVCPCCNLQFTMCLFSACPIQNLKEMWTCETCSRHVELTKTDRFEYCILCHSKKSECKNG